MKKERKKEGREGERKAERKEERKRKRERRKRREGERKEEKRKLQSCIFFAGQQIRLSHAENLHRQPQETRDLAAERGQFCLAVKYQFHLLQVGGSREHRK